MTKISTLLLIFLGLFCLKAKSQSDILRLNLLNAEALFLKNNHALLASNYQIEQAKADVITAKLFDNPELQYENLFYNQETKKFFQTSASYGQFAGSITQLFKLAGKRNKNIDVAQISVKMADIEYFDLMRSLKFELANTFYKVHFLTQSINVFDVQITSTAQLLKAYELQLKTGNIAQKDVIRIKSLLIGLNAERVDALNELENDLKDLKLLCGLPAAAKIITIVDWKEDQTISFDKITLTTLLDSAKANRSDIKLAKTDLWLNEANFKLQKAQAVPDVELSLSYDYKGNYPEKYTGIGIKIPLPLFNRNQGEIKKAKISIDAAKAKINQKLNLLENEVFNSYHIALRNEKLYTAINEDFSNQFNEMIKALIKNFKARHISLIEFLDLYEAYKTNTLQVNKIKLQRLSSRAEINFVTGSNIFK